jgi:hypothetical protein
MRDIQLIVAIFSYFFCLNTYAWKAFSLKIFYKKSEQFDFGFFFVQRKKLFPSWK